MVNRKNAPKLRFKGFTDEWEQRKLGDCLTEITYGFTNPMSDTDEGPWKITAKDVVNGTINYSTARHTSVDEFEQLTDKSKPLIGDILLTKDGTLGHTAIVNEENVCINQSVALLRCNETLCAPKMIKIILDSPYCQDKMIEDAGGGTIKHIYITKVDKMLISMPSKQEQVKIIEFFENLDNLIALHKRKCDKLKEYKKGCLQKMFPRDGADVPEVRFTGFTRAWERRKLLSCIQKITDFRGRTPKKLGMDWSDSGYLALSALNVKDGYIDFSQDVHYGDQELYDKWMAGNELHKGQVLFTTEAPMGNVAQVNDDRRYILSQRTIAFDVIEDLITENFLATVLRTPSVFSDLTALSSGGTAKGISQKSLASVDITIPQDLKEQERIADFFSNLSNLISLHQRKLEKMKNIKKAMLERMFV